ncbi:flagellar assembly protein FliW [Paenibacillus sp. sgz302251]|uniref:flagellar assembly protein FliW n=1 Tax=Paenibacillus sp. sgz302251 TaxID=3414493 RepID=UPI003C7A0BB1
MNNLSIIYFAQGIPGFEQYYQFGFVSVEGELPIKLMQSVEDNDISFLVASPFYFNPEYEVELSESTKQELDILTEEDVEVWSIVTMPSEPSQATINLLAPIIINRNKKIGKQLILHNSEYSSRSPLVRLRRG